VVKTGFSMELIASSAMRQFQVVRDAILKIKEMRI